LNRSRRRNPTEGIINLVGSVNSFAAQLGTNVFRLPHPVIVLGVLLLFGCTRSDSHILTQSDRVAAKVVALAYMIREFPPPDGYCISIGDREDYQGVAGSLSGTTIHCIGPLQDENGQHYDSNRLHVIHFSAEITSMDNRSATLTTELIAGPEGGNWYTVTIEKDDNAWVVRSARLEATS
jgi:hypothetical protein